MSHPIDEFSYVLIGLDEEMLTSLTSGLKWYGMRGQRKISIVLTLVIGNWNYRWRGRRVSIFRTYLIPTYLRFGLRSHSPVR